MTTLTSPLAEPESPRFRVSHQTLDLLTTERSAFLDITERVATAVRESGVRDGIVSVQTRHTTTAIVVNENEPLLLRDLVDLLQIWAPGDREYRHDDLERRQAPFLPDEPANGDSHARAVLLGSSESLSIAGGALQLGRWQRLFLVELDGPRSRSIGVTILGVEESAR